MAQDVSSPPSKEPKRKRDGKRLEIRHGYGDAAKKVFGEVKLMKHALGFENQCNTLEWMLTAVRRIFETAERHDPEHERTKKPSCGTKSTKVRKSNLKATGKEASGKPDSKR